MRVVIFANGTSFDPEDARKLVRSSDLVIAADGGTRHAWDADVSPDVVIGDLDSLTEDERTRLEAEGVDVVAFPARKDETDLELALLHAAREGVDEIVILAALGGRLDQTIANVLLLTLPELRGTDVCIADGVQTAFIIRDEATIKGKPGDTVSLIPLGGDAESVITEGLAWKLDDEALRFGPARGVSNVLEAEQARVCVRRGLLLCVVQHAGR